MSLLERPYGIGAESLGIFATIAKYYADSNLTLSQAVISQCRVLFSYLALIVVPLPSNVRFATAQVIFSSPLESPTIMAAVIGVLAIFGAVVYLLRRRPLTGLRIALFSPQPDAGILHGPHVPLRGLSSESPDVRASPGVGRWHTGSVSKDQASYPTKMV